MPNFIKVYSKTHQIATFKKNSGGMSPSPLAIVEPPSSANTAYSGPTLTLCSTGSPAK